MSAERECPHCGGWGEFYLDGWTGAEVPRSVWNQFPEERRDREMCQDCRGTGIVEPDEDYGYWLNYDLKEQEAVDRHYGI